MVGLVIGMLAIIVMLQVFALSEERKRTTTGTGDAQSAGVIAFYQLQRDIGQAGYGFSATDLFNCNIKWKIAGTDIATAIRLAPVTINPATSVVPAGDPNTDTLLIAYGNTDGEPQGNPIDSQSGVNYKVRTPGAFSAGNGTTVKPDRVIAAPASCSTNLLLDTVAVVATSTNTVQVTTGVAGITPATLYNLGPEPTVLAYRIHNGNLTACDYLANDCGLDANKNSDAVWVPVANNIVSMKALYGRDAKTTMDGIPSTYDKTTPGSAADTSGIAVNCGWARISAVRLALVARNSQLEKQAVTQNAPSWSGTSTNAIDLTKKPDGTDNPDWQRYRYKVLEGLVPVRNVAWMGVPTGC